jgi:hypothetical protein
LLGIPAKRKRGWGNHQKSIRSSLRSRPYVLTLSYPARSFAMLKLYFPVMLGIASILLAIRLENPDLRQISWDEAKLVKGAGCPIEGTVNTEVCAATSVAATCSWTNSSCSANTCTITCGQYKMQPPSSGCSGVGGICSTVPCQGATTVNAACPQTNTATVQSCTGSLYCGCGTPTYMWNCFMGSQTYPRMYTCQ